MTWLARYRAVLRDAGVGTAFAASLIGRLALAMTSLAILLLVRQSTGSYGSAGVVSASYALAFALGGPAQARAADRRGPVAVLIRCALVQPLALAALAALASRDAGTLVLVVPAVVGGLFVPPLGAVMRALWAARLAPTALPSAYSLESVLIELCFVVGPALVAVLTTWAGPGTAVLACSTIGLVGGVGMALSAAVRSVSPEDVPRARAGPLTSPAVRALLLSIVWIGAGFGAIEVAMPAFAEESGSRPATAGVLLAVWAAGSMLGGIAYGGSTPSRPPSSQIRYLVTALVVGSALPLAAPGPISMAFALLIYGSTIAPFMACNALLLSTAAPRGTTTEVFAWNSSMIVGGASLGTAAAGALIDAAGATAGLAVTTTAGVLALLASIGGRRRLV